MLDTDTAKSLNIKKTKKRETLVVYKQLLKWEEAKTPIPASYDVCRGTGPTSDYEHTITVRVYLHTKFGKVTPFRLMLDDRTAEFQGVDCDNKFLVSNGGLTLMTTQRIRDALDGVQADPVVCGEVEVDGKKYKTRTRRTNLSALTIPQTQTFITNLPTYFAPKQARKNNWTDPVGLP